MYSWSASVTVAFLVRWPPILCASSRRRSSIARFVGISPFYTRECVARRVPRSIPRNQCFHLPPSAPFAESRAVADRAVDIQGGDPAILACREIHRHPAGCVLLLRKQLENRPVGG